MTVLKGLAGGAGTGSGSTAPGKLNANPVWAPIFFRGRGITGTGSTVTLTKVTTSGANSQLIGWTPRTSPVFATRLVFPNFDISTTGELDRGSGVSWTSMAASLNFQMINTVPPSYTFSGSRTTTLPPALTPMPHGFIMSDPLYYSMPENNAFGVRVCGSLATTQSYAQASYTGIRGSNNNTRIQSGGATPGGTAITNFTEYDNRDGTTWTDTTQVTTVMTNTSGAGYTFAPMVLGLMHPPAASVVILGDSLNQGQSDTVQDAYFNVGWIQQTLQNKIPWQSFARGSVKASQFSTQALSAGVLSMILGTGMYVTDVVVGYGRNDIYSTGGSEAATKASLAGCALPFQKQGIPVHVQTVPPYTASQDGWVTLANQFYIYAAPTTTAQINPGATNFTVSSATNIVNGMTLGDDTGLAVAPGTTITISGTTVTIATGSITGTILNGAGLYFGNQTPTTAVTAAISYNANLRTGYSQGSYNNNGYVYSALKDIASVVGVQTGPDYKWAIGAALAPLTTDGIHMNQAGTDVIVTAGTAATTTFGIF